MDELRDFYSLTPDEVLTAVEVSGHRTTGRCYALNSLENRVYDVELEEGDRVIVKFYRPGRWSKATILDEHRFLRACKDHEIPVCAPSVFPDGSTLQQTDAGIYYGHFPRVGGRAPDEMLPDDLEQLGRYIGRIHRLGASLDISHRPRLDPEVYGTRSLQVIMAQSTMSPGIRARYEAAANELITLAKDLWRDVEMLPIHADLHRGNILKHPNTGWMLLDFDDMAIGPAVQDFWLLLPSRPVDCPNERDALLKGYEQFCAFDESSLRLVEVLRGLRYLRYAAWICERWTDPAFPRAFPQFGTDAYWEAQWIDLYEQIQALSA